MVLLKPLEGRNLKAVVKNSHASTATSLEGCFKCSTCLSDLEEIQAAEITLSPPRGGFLCFPLKHQSDWSGSSAEPDGRLWLRIGREAAGFYNACRLAGHAGTNNPKPPYRSLRINIASVPQTALGKASWLRWGKGWVTAWASNAPSSGLVSLPAKGRQESHPALLHLGYPWILDRKEEGKAL